MFLHSGFYCVEDRRDIKLEFTVTGKVITVEQLEGYLRFCIHTFLQRTLGVVQLKYILLIILNPQILVVVVNY